MARLRRSSRSVVHQAHAGSGALAELAGLFPDEALERLHSQKAGLEVYETDERLRISGPKRPSDFMTMPSANVFLTH